MSCKETWDVMSQWVDPNFFFSKTYGWHNMAIVGILGDYALNFLKGDMLEIGVGESSMYMSALAKKYSRKIYYCDSNADKVDDIKKSGYFAENSEIHVCLSDDMFANNTFTPLAFSFIDGYHSYEGARKDFWNVEKYTVPNGLILLHDSYPLTEDCCGNGGNGEVYKLRQELEQNKDFECFTFVGNKDSSIEPCYYISSTLVRKKPVNRPYYQE